MIPDINFMHESFERFNREIFGGELPIPLFRLTQARTFEGKCVYRKKEGRVIKAEIRLSVLFDQPREYWEDVMIHEMIHLGIAFTPECKETSHGPTFRRMMNTINNRFGRHLSVSARKGDVKRVESVQNVAIRRHYVCIGVTEDGRPVGFRAAASRMFKVWDAPSRFPGIKAWLWVAGIDSRLEKLPKALEPRFYYLQDMDEWRLILREVFALEKRGSTIYPGVRKTVVDWLQEHCPQLLP